MIVMAHARHWAGQLAYLAPVALVAVVGVRGKLRRRRGRREVDNDRGRAR
jgi:hypothetical protein